MTRIAKPSLTLSQRRALLRGLDAEGRVVRVASTFRAQPFARLVELGYAQATSADALSFRLTAAGVTRAVEINPDYRAWAPGETVTPDASARPVAGTHRQLPQADRQSRFAWLAHA